MSGGTENTKYYVSGLVKDDGGIATNTGYKKQAVRSNVDQELGGGFSLGVNPSGTHSLSKRGLSNNDNSGTSPFLVFPFTPNFMDLLPTQTGDSLVPSDFPNNPFERSNPLQTFQFLTNDEDVWRACSGLPTLRVERDPQDQEQPPVHRHRGGGLFPAGQQLRLAARAASTSPTTDSRAPSS